MESYGLSMGSLLSGRAVHGLRIDMKEGLAMGEIEVGSEAMISSKLMNEASSLAHRAHHQNYC